MSKACGATCGLCGATSCKDQIGACSAMKTMCRDIAQQAFMKQNCARTCGFCTDLFGFNGGNVGIVNPRPARPATDTNNGGTRLSGGCRDNTSGRGNDCASMAGYCNSALYRDLMRQECPRTCGFC
ncbi:Protein C14C6.2 [Aphelenchoides avenae]|nr:Protein C14C6.2 [Aphelenchus avenae]